MNKKEKMFHKILDAIIDYHHPYNTCWFYVNNNIKAQGFTLCYQGHKDLATQIQKYTENKEKIEFSFP